MQPVRRRSGPAPGLGRLAAAAPLSTRRNEIVLVVEKVSPAVVNISAEQIQRRRPSLFDDFFFGFDSRPRRRTSQSLGSGAIIDAKGIIVTNEHVVSGASKITAMTKSGIELECDVVGSDSDNDLAVLRVTQAERPLPAIQLGSSSDLMIGETIVAIGNPFGLSQHGHGGRRVGARAHGHAARTIRPTPTSSRPTPRSTPATRAARSSTSTAT